MFFDIGANVGKWSLANLNNASKIIAIEAVPETYIKLQNNTSKHKKILCLNFAVANSDKEYIDFYNCDCDTLSTLNKNWFESEESRFYKYKYNTIKCKTISIDKLIKIYGIPELIKIDVEGGEFECISSLTQKVKLLCFEWASETNMITLNCIEHLLNLGYTQYYIQYQDNYLFRPKDNDFYDIYTIRTNLSNTIPKKHWGMIWCR
jgi:FkbM family methyltransferase